MHTPHIEWPRPEYTGRDTELIHLAEAARIAGVTRAAISNWATRHPTFPAVAKVITGPGTPRKFIPRTEFTAFLEEHADRTRTPGPKEGSSKAPHRPAATIAADRVDHYTRRITALQAREQEQAERLAKTRAALELAKGRARQAQEKLQAELDAADQARATR
ncbi:hypothetical protein [Nocardiopsis sp. LOL_012]|uniref:hypothetical protein n=1 Tax=Nocardiopsis sp. LOL_012 TaxID=3345409 RepID=UPI003A888D5C